MQHRSELHLIIPGICGPLAETQSLRSSPVIDRWLRTLATSSCGPSADNISEVFTELFGLKIKDDLPTAALTLLAHERYEKALSYMHADLVHLQADMDHAVLTSSADLDISDVESSTLCEALNQHFSQDGLRFFSIDKNRWFVTSKAKISMSTTPLVDATGRNVNFLLPQGEDSAYWKQVLTEAQMLMHSHDVNSARENIGAPAINSLWFHGSGRLTDELTASGDNTKYAICSNDDMLKGLAQHLRYDYLTVPDTVNEYAEYLLSSKHDADCVLHLTELEHVVNYTDVNLWLSKLSGLLDDWIYPLINIANKNNIKVKLYPCNGKRYQFSKYDSLRFWRHVWHRVELEEYVSSY